MAIYGRFLSDNGGNFGVMASLLSVPLLMCVGLSVDYVNVQRVSAQLQNAIDSAVLAVAHEGDRVSDAEAELMAIRFLQENFDEPFSDLAVVRAGTNVTVSAKAETTLAFGGLIGKPKVELTKTASSAISYANYEIALVLDTTGSMAGGKLAAMKDAVKGLIDTMSLQVPRPGALKFSLVPFSSKVNVGANFGPAYNASGAVTRAPAAWLDAMAHSPISQNDLDPGISRFVLFKQLNLNWEGCVEARASTASKPYDVDDTVPNVSEAQSLFVPAFASDEPDSGSYPNSYLPDGAATIGAGTPIARMVRYGASYVPTFKELAFDGQVAAAASWTPVSGDFSNQTYYGGYPTPKGPNFGCDVQPIAPLTSNFGALKSKVDGLVALGSTNIVEGAAWGWRTLSSRAPFTEGRPKNDLGVEKIMVLLTDGTNNLGRIPNSLGSAHSSFGYLIDGRLGISSGSSAQVTEAMNNKTLQACTNAKADGIELYTIRLEEPDVTTGTMLRECASDADHYFDVPNRSMLDEAFGKIKDRIARIRLAS